MKSQRGLVLVLALLVLVSVTILGVSAVSSSLLQSRMATSMQQNGIAFDAAEAAIAGVIYESEDTELLQNVLLDPLSEARLGNVYDPDNNQISCSDSDSWTSRYVTSSGMGNDSQHITDGSYQTSPATKSWSRTAFVAENACAGSSAVIGGVNINCHVFVVRGCGSVEGKSTVFANTLAASVYAPASK